VVSGLVPSPRSRFERAIQGPDAEVELARAALLVAAEEYPQLPVDAYLHRLDVLAERTRDRLGGETAPTVVLQSLLRVVFEEEGLRGNAEAYYDPRNSFLNDVLDRRRGIPLTLSIVVLEVGWRLGLPLHGVNFPGHFLVAYEGESGDFLIDAFDRGAIRFRDEGQALLDRVYGGGVRLREAFFQRAGRREILARLLSNLKGIYLNARDDRRALHAIERLLLVSPEVADEVRDRGLLLARAGRVGEAIDDLERYLALAPGAPDLPRVQGLLRDLREHRGE
jgi:regulator of sirC expression with transglutaminase-like and TPR domain